MLSVEQVRNLLTVALGGEEAVKSLRKHPKRLEIITSAIVSRIASKDIENAGLEEYWGVSRSKEPSPEHMPFYGKKLKEIPNGERPGDRYGCKCTIIVR